MKEVKTMFPSPAVRGAKICDTINLTSNNTPSTTTRTSTAMSDPLSTLPPELILQIIDLLPLSAAAQLTRVSRAWHSFIDTAHQDRIYSSPSKVSRPETLPNIHDFSFLDTQNTFTKPYHGVSSWKDLAKRQTLLRRNLDAPNPVTRESIFQVGALSRVWRFKPDFRRRFFLSTSELQGGVDVTDMSDGRRLWRNDGVREYAHLEYDPETGTAAWDAFGDVVEVWRVVEDNESGQQRGVFRQLAVLRHDVQIRGFELSNGNLCVVSSQGRAFVYDIVPEVKLKTTIHTAEGAIGHLHQDRDVVIISMGNAGYHVHNKTTGAHLGVIDPERCTNRTHIKSSRPPEPSESSSITEMGPTTPPFPPSRARRDRLIPLRLERGPSPVYHTGLVDGDDWGACLLDGSCMAGISRHGSLFITSDWRKALAGQYDETSILIECETDPTIFDLGGWLTLRHGKVAMEVDDCIYLVRTQPKVWGDDDDDDDVEMEKSASVWAMYSTSVPRFNQPVSFMGIYEDCFMHTYWVSIAAFPALGQRC